MNYSNSKYDRYCTEKSDTDFYKPYFDIVIDGKKIYKVAHYKYFIEDYKLNHVIDDYVIGLGYVLHYSSQSRKEIVLKHPTHDCRIIFNAYEDADGKYYEIELILPVPFYIYYKPQAFNR